MAFVQKRIHDHGGGFGADLAELRELRGYTKERLAKISGIHPAIIASLETEQLQDFADPVYAERHVRTLVKILEGRTEFFLQKYRELLESRQLAHAPDKTLRLRVRKRDFFVTSRLVVFLGFFAVVGAIGWYVIFSAMEITKAPMLAVSSPIEGEKTSSPHVTVEGTTDPQAAIRVNGQNAIVDETGRFKTIIDIPSGVSTIRIEARRRYSNVTTVERHLMFIK